MRTANRSDQVELAVASRRCGVSAEFQEREIFDLLRDGVQGHPDLRRLLMWDGFKDHPMRRDYVEPDDFEYEPTAHDEVLRQDTRASKCGWVPLRAGRSGANDVSATTLG